MTPTASQACGCWGSTRGVWHHQDRRRRGPRELTGIVDHSRGGSPHGKVLDLVPGRSGTVHENWLEERGEDFRSGIQIATLDPSKGETVRTPSLGLLPGRHQRPGCLPYRQARWRRPR